MLEKFEKSILNLWAIFIQNKTKSDSSLTVLELEL